VSATLHGQLRQCKEKRRAWPFLLVPSLTKLLSQLQLLNHASIGVLNRLYEANTRFGDLERDCVLDPFMQRPIEAGYAMLELKSIQILRAVAAISVVYSHIAYSLYAPIPRPIPAFGLFGVDIFFVISGFVMAMVVAKGHSARSFAISRLTRIVPLYWILTTCLLLLAATKPELLSSTTINLLNYLKSLFFIPYFKENGSLTPMLTVGWTLNYEMFFYLCMWMSLFVVKRFYIQATIILIILCYVFASIATTNNVLSSFFGNTQIFEFILGLLLYKTYGLRQSSNHSPFIPIVIATMTYIFMAYGEMSGFSGNKLLLYGIPSAALVYSVLHLENVFTQGNQKVVSILTTIGAGSYATYLSQLYVIEGVIRIMHLKWSYLDPFSIFGTTFIIMSALIVGHLLYTYIDKPIGSYLKRQFLTVKPAQQLVSNETQGRD